MPVVARAIGRIPLEHNGVQIDGMDIRRQRDEIVRMAEQPGWAARAGLLAMLALTAACGGSGSTTPTSPSTPPPSALSTLVCPAPMSLTTVDTSAPATYEKPTAQGGVPPIAVTCIPESGQPFPLGSTDIRCTATDQAGQTASCTFAVAVSRLPTFAKTRFLAFGDSVTLGVIATANPGGDPPEILREVPNESYPAVLQQLLASRYTTQAITVINAGKGGETAVDGAHRVLGEIRRYRPDVVLVLDGYNDLRLGASGIGPGLVGVNDIVKVARFEGVRVFIATLTPPNVHATRGISNSVITVFNDGIRAMARGENAVLVDVYQAMASDPNRYNSADGLHPNEAGYRKIAETFLAALSTELENASHVPSRVR